MRRGRTTALVLGVGGCLAFERWTRRTRATPREELDTLPGDELVPEPMWQATRATTIHTSRDAVWPWLVQMGYPTHRAGWYIPLWLSHTHPLPIYRDVSFSWAFVLRDAGSDTRLVIRARISYTPVCPAPVIRFLVAAGFSIGDVIQAGAMLDGIRSRAESHRS